MSIPRAPRHGTASVLWALALATFVGCSRAAVQPQPSQASDAQPVDVTPSHDASLPSPDAEPDPRDAASLERMDASLSQMHPRLSFRTGAEESDVDVVRDGIPAIADDGSLAVVRFESDGSVCGLPVVGVFDIAHDKMLRAFVEPQARCDHATGLPLAAKQPNPLWKDWETAFDRLVGGRPWAPLAKASSDPAAGDPVRRVVVDGLVVRLDAPAVGVAGPVKLVVDDAQSGATYASIDLVKAHASSSVHELRKTRPWSGRDAASLLEVYASRAQRVVVARTVLSLGDNASFPAMDHALRWTTAP